jgi:hypothetical protein
LAIVGALSLASAEPARAGTFTADLCAGPSGALVGTSGLREQLLGEAFFVSGEDSCQTPGQELTLQLGPNSGGYSNLQGGEYVYATPAGVTISAYALRLSAYAASCALASGHCPGGVGQVFVNHTGELDPHYDFRDLGEGALGPTAVAVSGLLGVHEVVMGATCDSGCPSAEKIASFALAQAQFTLVDSTVPRILARSGPTEGDVLSGVAEWSFSASDAEGSGIYRVVESVDGKTLGTRVLDENGGLCKDLGGEGERVFASPAPCASEAGGAASVETNDLADGQHSVRVYVESAAGDTADVFDGKLATANGPIVSESPQVSGVAQVGLPLTATNGAFSLRPEQEWAGPLSGQWESCVSASSCQPIKGATGTTYAPTAADVGRALAYQSVATAKVTDASARGLAHTTVAESVHTVAVSEAGGSGPGCLGGCGPGQGGGNGGNGANGGSGGSGSGASGASGANSGSGVNVTLGGLGGTQGPGVAQLGSAARWRISLTVSPHHVHRRSRIRLSGRVQTAPRPQAGKLVYLQARDVRAHLGRVRGRLRVVAVYGRWITFMALRAGPSGGFSTAYRFRLGGRHTYQFRAVAPAEGQFRNPTGSSPLVTVRET